MHKKWKNQISKNKTLLQRIKNTKGVGEFLTNLPNEGEMRDNISKNVVKISDCKDSTLRRYEKLLKKYYQLVETPNDRKIISDKLNEIILEINKRPTEDI